MFYRVQQFYQALRPRLTDKDRELIASILPPSAQPLFWSQSPVDQRHGLDVAWDLLEEHSSPNLIAAALLHDCGKARYSLKIWHRVYIVLCANLPRNIQRFLKSLDSKRFGMPLRLAEEHPAWGAELAKKARLNEEIIELIRNHHCPQTEAGRILYQADNRH